MVRNSITREQQDRLYQWSSLCHQCRFDSFSDWKVSKQDIVVPEDQQTRQAVADEGSGSLHQAAVCFVSESSRPNPDHQASFAPCHCLCDCGCLSCRSFKPGVTSFDALRCLSVPCVSQSLCCSRSPQCCVLASTVIYHSNTVKLRTLPRAKLTLLAKPQLTGLRCPDRSHRLVLPASIRPQ